MAVYETQVEIPASPEDVFDFLARPKNAELIAPPGTAVEIIDAPDVIAVGSFIEFDVAGFGPKQRMLHEIVDVVRPHRIVERQVEGPFGLFEHEAHLRSDGNGGVILLDRIEFEPPSGLLGFLLTEKRIRALLEEGYEHRHEELQRRFSK